jgi:hypothetical protein
LSDNFSWSFWDTYRDFKMMRDFAPSLRYISCLWGSQLSHCGLCRWQHLGWISDNACCSRQKAYRQSSANATSGAAMLPQGASSRSEEDYAALVTQVALAFNALFVRLLFLLFSRQRKCDTYALLRLVGPLDPFKAGCLQSILLATIKSVGQWSNRNCRSGEGFHIRSSRRLPEGSWWYPWSINLPVLK